MRIYLRIVYEKEQLIKIIVEENNMGVKFYFIYEK